jgi:hypothetical protein
MALFQCRQATTTAHCKKYNMTFITFDLRNDNSENILGQDQEFLMMNALK